MRVTRRKFLTHVGQAGGFGAAFLGLQAFGLMPVESLAAPIRAAAGSGAGKRVVMLGGGTAGLVAAYELRKLGYTCTVLEARERPGGRVWTIRGGDQFQLTDGTQQTCAFSEGLYQNAGAARLPSTHKTMLDYCRQFAIPLEVEINTSRSALLQNDKANGGKPVVQRQAINDARGHVSELLGKCVTSGALDRELTKQDVADFVEFLRNYGPLDKSGKYLGSDRAGYSVDPGAGENAGTYSSPLSMRTLLDGNFWDGLFYEESYDWQATMLQPVGGMDRIPKAFAARLGDIVQYGAAVTEMRKTATGVRVSYKQHGTEKALDADFCFCGLPLNMLRKVRYDLSPPYRKVVEESTMAGYYKVAWESRRFWEQDYHIYGGLEFVSEGCSPIWLPSAGLQSERGVLVSGYDETFGTLFEKLTLREKFEASRKSVEKLHERHGKELEKPVYIGWGQMPWNEGSWIRTYGPRQDQHDPYEVTALGHPIDGAFANPGYETLLRPDGPVYFVGDHMSYLVGWQEGAALSSLRAIQLLSDRVRQAA
ncbi:MAG TPA: FAD-dependent oxidoreductase [Acidobacteriaceae bacterium]|jgi:monoamine oxidase